MSVSSTLYTITPDFLEKLRSDNELFGALFGEDVDDDALVEAASLDLIDFEDTHTLLTIAGYPALQEALDFENGDDEAFQYAPYDIQVAAPPKVKEIAEQLAPVTLAEVREKGLYAEFRTDRRHQLLAAEDYEEQFEEIERVRDFFAAAANAGNAVVAAAS